jgi:hypothetical protein
MKSLTVSKLVTGLALVSIGASAQAFDTAQEMRKLELCRAAGDLAEIGYQNRGTYIPSPLDEETKRSGIGGIMEFAYNYGHDEAADRRDAHMVAFGKCVDNLDRAARRAPGNYLTEDDVRH